MPRIAEIDYYSWLIASLTVSAARAASPEALAEIQCALAAAHREMFTVLSHDAGALHPDLDAELAAAVRL